MKKVICVVTLIWLVAFATSALAQDTSAGSADANTPESFVVSVGKDVAVGGRDDGGIVALPVFPAFLTAVGTFVPQKYKSKKNYLLINTTYQAVSSTTDTGKSICDTVTVDVFFAWPDPLGLCFFSKNAGNDEFETRSRAWFMLPESEGGPAIPNGATVTLRLSASTFGAGSATVGSLRAIQVESIK